MRAPPASDDGPICKVWSAKYLMSSREDNQCTESAVFHDGMMSLTGVASMSCNNPP